MVIKIEMKIEIVDIEKALIETGRLPKSFRIIRASRVTGREDKIKFHIEKVNKEND